MTSCEICQEAPATAIKVDVEETYDADGNSHVERVTFPICDTCEDAYYDGTETHPGTLPLI